MKKSRAVAMVKRRQQREAELELPMGPNVGSRSS